MTSVFKILIFVGVISIVSGCGRKGSLIYPDMLTPSAPENVVAQQSGSAVKLQFTVNSKDRAGRPLQGLAGVKINRRTNDVEQKDVCRSCMTDYRLLRTVYMEKLSDDAQRFGSRIVLLDGDVKPGKKYSYIIFPFTSDGVEGAASEPVETSLFTVVPAPLLTVESLPTEIRIHLTPSALSGEPVGFNIYRSTVKNSHSFFPINAEPVKGCEYVDTAVQRGLTYNYTARALVADKSGKVAESEESVEVEGKLYDEE
ncbi:MAG: hypothetical protein PHN84_14145 [Desulfuromonadaceae bacterium]|nr:hypothetical protein [Desulfuromonadaceae bacterium]MDD2856755.1 hypothetical protein [Desulfuromonadaceae bacterium]